MAYAATIEMVQGDDLPAIAFKIRDRNTPVDGVELDARDPETWRPLDLTDKTVVADVRERGAAEVLETIPVIIIDPLTGAVALNIIDATFKENAGSFEVETVVTTAAQLQQTVYDMALIKIRERVKVADNG